MQQISEKQDQYDVLVHESEIQKEEDRRELEEKREMSTKLQMQHTKLRLLLEETEHKLATVEKQAKQVQDELEIRKRQKESLEHVMK